MIVTATLGKLWLSMVSSVVADEDSHHNPVIGVAGAVRIVAVPMEILPRAVGQRPPDNTSHGEGSTVTEGQNAKVLIWGTNFGRTLFELPSSDFVQIFTIHRGGGSCRWVKKCQNLVHFKKIEAKVHPGRKFQPSITPPIGGDCTGPLCYAVLCSMPSMLDF